VKNTSFRYFRILLNNSLGQLQSTAPMLLLVYAVLLVMLISIAVLSSRLNIDLENFIKDPALLSDSHPLKGFLSNAGVLIWCAAAAICFFVSMIHSKHGDKKVALFFLFSGLFTTVLLFDDFFMFHDYLMVEYLRAPQEIL